MNTLSLNIKKYGEFLAHNNYTELLVEIAKDFKIDFYRQLFEAILTIHNTEGYMSPDVAQARTRYKNEMMHILKNELSEDDYIIISQII